MRTIGEWMLSIDTNILVYAYNFDSPEHPSAIQYLTNHLEDTDVAISEYVLVEFYNMIRNAVVMPTPFTPAEAVEKVMELRLNPNWTLLRTTVDVSDGVWSVAKQPQFPRRAIFDARLAHSLAAAGVKRFATRNVADFKRFGLFDVFDPIV